MKGTITTKTQYTPAGQTGSVESPETSASTDSGAGGTATGEAGGQGNSASAENPNNEGGTDTTEERWTMPDGATFTNASVRLTLECGPNETLTLTCEGNVSVSGQIADGCISCVEVKTQPGPNGVVRKTTRRKKKCCAG